METKTAEREPEQILDDNKVRVAGSMHNRILLSMKDYADQQCKAEREKAINAAITVVTCNDFSMISQMVMALEKLKLKQP